MRRFFIFLLLLASSLGAIAQSFSFEEGSRSPFQLARPESGKLFVVDAPYKDGISSLCWEWNRPSEIMADVPVSHKNFRDGLICWIYNEKPVNQPLRAEYRDAQQNVHYLFSFNLNFSGWRICRIGSKYMKGDKKVQTGLKLHFLSPEGIQNGRLFIDRLSFVGDVDYQNAPDAQQPENTESLYINHWNSLWKWESTYQYDIPLKSSLTTEEKLSLSKIMKGVAEQFPQKANADIVKKAKDLLLQSGIRKQGNFFIGSPLVLKPDKKKGDIALAELGIMMYGLAQDYTLYKVKSSGEKFLLVWDFAVDQGFCWGSAMGVNHHYGYESRQIFQALFLMRDLIKETGRIGKTVEAIGFWSGLPETRLPYNPLRDGVVDGWNTLLFPRLIAAMMIDDECEKYRAVEGLTRWVNGSLMHTPGNYGGIKRDGTVFHHAGAYPAYAIGGLGELGQFFACINPSSFKIELSSRLHLANALLSMSRYTNTTDWSIGMAGRHPLDGSMSPKVIEAFGNLALSGGIYHPSEKVDKVLAQEYLRLETSKSNLKKQIISLGFTPGAIPEGFFVFNHAALGIHRTGKSMVSLKGYNSDVWGSEIYTANNRFGRYQSYGAIEIYNGGNPVSRNESRFNENGWDWNRLPGTTTIHLPLNLLESPIKTTLMARSREDFAGASVLNDSKGIFGMKLREENDINNTHYTPDFVARKSVFAFGKRLICLGSDINNSNADFPTETTLFQNALKSTSEKITLEGGLILANGLDIQSFKEQGRTLLSDVTGNYYLLSPYSSLRIKGGIQKSLTNDKKVETQGLFVTAWLDHGRYPQDASYEYMIMLQPSEKERDAWSEDPQYQVLQQDKQAHMVEDLASKTTACVFFEETKPQEGLIVYSDRETLVLFREQETGTLSMSVCDPSLHLPEKTNNSDETSTTSEKIEKIVKIRGNWKLKEETPLLTLHSDHDITTLTILCQYGEPVPFSLTRSDNQIYR